jgi:hypothetical protein
MTRDRFDNELRRKLDDVKVAPPADMWERIAATLDERGLTAVETAETATRRKPAIRRPRRMRLGWAAVAAVALCVAVFSLRQVAPRPETTVAQQGPVDTQQGPVVLSPEDIGALIAATTEPQAEAEVVIAWSFGHGRPNLADRNEQLNYVLPEFPESEPEFIVREVDIYNKTRSTISDMGRGRAPADYWSEIAEDLGMGRRAAPVGMAVYASNLGGLSNEKVMNNTGRARASTMGIYEKGPGQTQAQLQPYELKHRMPLSGGVSVSRGLTDRLAVESGLTYTYMLSQGKSYSKDGWAFDIEQKLHYVGIPVGVSYDIISGRNVDLYAGAGALFEMCVSGTKTKTPTRGGERGKTDLDRLNVKGMQPSVDLRIGAEVKIDKMLGLYVEPGLNYYFENYRQPESYRTEHALNLSLRAGLRINL